MIFSHRHYGKTSSSYVVETVVRGYHVYKDVWNASTGQILPCSCSKAGVLDTTMDVVSSRNNLFHDASLELHGVINQTVDSTKLQNGGIYKWRCAVTKQTVWMLIVKTGRKPFLSKQDKVMVCQRKNRKRDKTNR